MHSVDHVGTYSPGIGRIPHLASMLGVGEVANLWTSPGARVSTVVTWGRKPNARVARFLARMRNRAIVQLEDGFLRSIGLGVEGAAPLSIVVDPEGIYYDSTRPSRLESLLAGSAADAAALDDARLIARAAALVTRLRTSGISKYNGGLDHSGLPRSARRRVLVVDQTDRDLSLRLGGAMPGGLGMLTRAALDENPDAEVVVKIHPDVLSGRRSGHEHEIPVDPRVTVVSTWVHPSALLREVDDVYVMTSQLGFDALVHGHRVHCFGVPFYAGWGLTNDRVPTPRRRVARSLEQLVAAALILYPRYVDPATGLATGPEQTIDRLASMRRALLATQRANDLAATAPALVSIRAAG